MKKTSTAELEYRLLYSMVVAGKSATFAGNAMNRFLADTHRSPFDYILYLLPRGRLLSQLKEARTGNYQKLARGFALLAKARLDLRTCSPQDLEEIHGIGPKTSRFFILWTRPGAKHAALDTHVLKWLRYLGHDAPISTPSRSKYASIEKVFLACARARGMSARELDAAIWDWCSAGNHRNGTWPENLRRRIT